MSLEAGSTIWFPGSPSLELTQSTAPPPAQSGPGLEFTRGANERPSWDTDSTSWLFTEGRELSTASYSSNRLRFPSGRVPVCAYHILSTGVFGAAAQFVCHVSPWSVETL